MANIPIGGFRPPIKTGNAAAAPQATGTQKQPAGIDQSFLRVLQGQLEASSSTAFSKHAVSRVLERNIDISGEKLERLDQGVQLAQQKGLRDALILIDRSAYIVNTAAGRVVTVDGEATSGSVYTNIDGTVIV